MKINLVCPVIILDNESNPNIRKNDVKKFKLLVDNTGSLVTVEIDSLTTLKDALREKISEIIGSNVFHLEQVYTLGESKYAETNALDIIHLAVTNIENVKSLSNEYKLIDLDISNNAIHLDGKSYTFSTREKIANNNVEYYHEINADNLMLEKMLLELLIAYKQLRKKLDNTDIIFKFMPKYFSLEDVRMVYEKINEVSVDKSNFRKRVAKYCVETEKDLDSKGHRPCKLYTFKVLKGDIWL